MVNIFKSAGLLASLMVSFCTQVYAAEPIIIQDCDTCPKLIVLESGKFVLGAEQEEGRRWKMLDRMSANEGPRVDVTIESAFALGQMEVTRGQFAAFVSETGFKPKKGCFHLTSAGWSVQPKLDWQNPGYEVTDDHPVACLQRSAILAYLDWLSDKTGQPYRLPSEAEYEYAARAGTDTTTFWGEDWTTACAYQNGADLTFVPNVPDIPYGQYADCDDGYVFTSPVATYEANPWGFYDLAGNVSESTADCYSDSHEGMPKDGSPVAKSRCRAWVAKGGSWAGFPGLLRPATRLRIRAATTGTGFGFRVARDIQD